MGAIVASGQRLPARLGAEVNRVAEAVLDGLHRLGFVYRCKDGSEVRVCLARRLVVADKWLALQVDVRRLPPRVNVVSLASSEVTDHLEACCGYPVRVVGKALDGKSGLTYAVSLAGDVEVRKSPQFPARADLDLGSLAVGRLLVPVGVGAGGPVWCRLVSLGHALIGGATGSGKSTWLHVALAGLLSGGNGPDRLRVALVDPKRCEMAMWTNVSHLWGHVAYTTSEATALLENLAREVDRRGEMFAELRVRDIGGYNRMANERLPFVLAIVDEGLDLVLDAGPRSGLVSALRTLAMRGRSAGVFVWLATQHAAAAAGLPRVVNVNLATRLVFRVLDRSAAEVAGAPGAERLPGRAGRMLARLGGGEAQELQGFYLDDDQLLEVAGGLVEVDGGQPSGGIVLTPQEAALVRYALDELGGEFVVNKLGEGVAGWTRWRVMKLAQRWEKAGLLSSPEHATDARRVQSVLVEALQEVR